MITKYQALLDKMAASDMPPDAQYRINVEKLCRFRIKAAQENLNDPDKVEELCNCGQVEELVIQADNESNTETVAAVLDAAREAGVYDVSLATEDK